MFGTVNILEYCRRSNAGLVLLSTSRVYGIRPLAELPLKVEGSRFVPDFSKINTFGLSSAGVGEEFCTAAPVSLYGATKLASETLALEYCEAFWNTGLGKPVRRPRRRGTIRDGGTRDLFLLAARVACAKAAALYRIRREGAAGPGCVAPGRPRRFDSKTDSKRRGKTEPYLQRLGRCRSVDVASGTQSLVQRSVRPA